MIVHLYGRWVFAFCLAVTVFALGYSGYREYYQLPFRTSGATFL